VTTELAPARRQAPAGDGGTLTGTSGLLRFLLRRDRIKLPAWTLGIAVFTIYYATALPEIFPTEEDLRSAAAFTAGPIGALIGGPGYGFDDLTIPRFLVGVYGLYFLLAAALMNILLVTRHTRVEEQTGRAELVRANVVGRHAPLTATLILAVITNALLTVLMFGGLVASDLDLAVGGAAVFAASVGAAGLCFAGITAATVQVTEYSRAAAGLAGAALGAAYVIRAAGDMLEEQGSWLSWLSPLAWSQQTAPFVLDRWWPLALSVAFFGVTAVTG
jgi:ABC-2 type transport system permease protein